MINSYFRHYLIKHIHLHVATRRSKETCLCTTDESHSTGHCRLYTEIIEICLSVWNWDYTVPKVSKSLKHCYQIFGNFLLHQNCSLKYIYNLLPWRVSILTQHANLYGILLRPFKCDSSAPLWQRDREEGGVGGERLKINITTAKNTHCFQRASKNLANRTETVLKLNGGPSPMRHRLFTLMCHSGREL